MVSKQIIPINGLSITVYGLQECNLLPKGTPVAVMFALHGRLQNQAKMEPLAFALCKLNECRQQTDRYLLIVTFDAPNHGTRLLNKTANYGWNEGNDSHALDMWSMIHSTSHTVTELINVLEYYLFGPQKNPVVQVWGVTGFSLGGHASFLSAAKGTGFHSQIKILILYTRSSYHSGCSYCWYC
ncbi:uncharacterized protein B0P05DRAFT_481015 [Gilbertella persicaria]|uniref:uncharacterized protein n=1 Tax=Gilbertella persicaria TaxID=101096 RepID=UPI00221E7114|nr:uncharacterized protein B0P05DRAFT_481015 [Gilbertella persicaria]KAI8048328.1 hypothetical protein B0P05DRAFT_481015 [Gilbertella persicaria]